MTGIHTFRFCKRMPFFTPQKSVLMSILPYAENPSGVVYARKPYGECAGNNSMEGELIISLPKLDDRCVYKINRQLACLEGLHFSGYYGPASCLLLKYDPDKILDPAIISTIVHHLNHKIKVQMIRGIRIYDVVDGKIDEPIRPSKKAAQKKKATSDQ